MKATLHSDGGARGNPGPAGIGFVLHIEGKDTIERSEFIGEATNNQAEYQAIIAGLLYAREQGVMKIACYLDSELVVKQLKGEYRVKHENMKSLYRKTLDILAEFDEYTLEHVPREKNANADNLVNRALDDQKTAR